MYERFTDRARKVIQLANQEAQRLNHEYIGTDHILLGLVKEGSGVAANVLKNLNIDLHRIRLEVERIAQFGPHGAMPGKLPLTPRAKKVIEHSTEEARSLNHNYVGTEHLLLGLVREQEGLAAQVLLNLGLALADVRREVRRLLGVDVSVVADSPLPEDLILEYVKNLPPLKPVLKSAAADVHSAKCCQILGLWIRTPVVRVVAWGLRHGNLTTFLAGFAITIFGSLLARCFGQENINAGAVLAGTAYIFTIAMAYWPYWDRCRPAAQA
jgi:hypothetical protein